MMTLRTSESTPVLIEMYMTSPSVYLDYSAIAMLAQDMVRAEFFRGILAAKNGTLAVSSAHLIEACGLGLGPAFSRIKSFLDSLDNRFVILNFNADEVIAKEKRWKNGDPSSVFDMDLAKRVFNEWDGLSPLTAGTLLLNFQNNPNLSQKYKDLQAKQKDGLKAIFDNARYEYRNNPVAHQNIDKRDCFDAAFNRTEQVYCLLRRETIRTNEAFNDSDGFDFWHSVVATSHMDFVVHDKKWARRLRAINLPPRTATIFAGVEMDLFLTSLAA